MPRVAFGFRFLDFQPLVDVDLQLVPPDEALVDALAASDEETEPHITRLRALDLLVRAPGGHEPGQLLAKLFNGDVPVYHFWMKLEGGPVPIGGMISLRIGDTRELRLYGGHIGYHVFPAARGRRLAGRATKLLLPLARAHGLKTLWITANPDNLASRRTIERLGAELIGHITLPKWHGLYRMGERRKVRYRLDL
jgi:tagatose 1,6-diphosphate aldolase